MEGSQKLDRLFAKISNKATKIIGSYQAFIVTIVLIFFWLGIGPLVHFSDTWQLYINTISTLTTSLIVILIQYGQNKNDVATHIKLDAIIKSLEQIDDKYKHIEELDEAELKELREEL